MRPFFLLLLTAAILPAAEEIWYKQPARTEADAFPLGDGNSAVWRVYGDPKSGRIQRGNTTVVIDWLDADQPLTDYRRSLDLQDGIATTSWKRGGSTITTKVLADPEDGVLLIHLQADMPGALGFRVSIPDPESKATGNRGELQGAGVRLWALPFESEVHPDGKAMTIRGEGEAMILVCYGKGGSLPELGLKYDGRDKDPDLTKVWSGALDAHVAQQRARLQGFSVDLGGHEAREKPTDERLRATDAFKNDPDLAALMLLESIYRTGLCLPTEARPDSDWLFEWKDALTLLPSPPAAWKSGTLKAFPFPVFFPGAGEYTLDMTWKDGLVTSYSVHRSQPGVPEKIRVKVNGKEAEVPAQ